MVFLVVIVLSFKFKVSVDGASVSLSFHSECDCAYRVAIMCSILLVHKQSRISDGVYGRVCLLPVLIDELNRFLSYNCIKNDLFIYVNPK